MLSVREYAYRQQISVSRVNQLIHAGQVHAQKVGSLWVIPESELTREAPITRPFGATNAWAFIDMLSGQEPAGVGQKARWRLRTKLRILADESQPAAFLSSWLRGRAPVLDLRAHPLDLGKLRHDRRLILSGVSDPRASLDDSRDIEAYIDPDLVEELRRDYQMNEGENPNVRLHLARVQVDAAGQPPLGLLIADLADRVGPQAHLRVRELLDKQKDGQGNDEVDRPVFSGV